MFITTKKGDGGWTEYGGRRIKKNCREIEMVGALDELQAVLGIVDLPKIQKDIYLLMAGKEAEVDLDKEIEKLEKKVKPIDSFVIFKNKKAIYLNWVRTIVRRAERIRGGVYLNRLSDYIYLLALTEEQK